MASLGVTLNNPCNIRFNPSNHWKGQTGSSKGFCKFLSMDMGVRAVLSILRTYCYVYGLDTVRKIITRFAPPSENNTNSYIDFVVLQLNQQSGVYFTADSHLYLDFFDYKGVTPLFYLVKAMCLIESKYVLSPSQFERSLKLLHS